MTQMKVSLIISTYNRPDALLICLASIKNQSLKPDEVIIGDDGSTPETKKLIDEFKKDFFIPIFHIWQEDQGFRLAKMRNRCVAQASGEYIIEVDGDVFFHRHFIRDHIALSREGCYVKGVRVNLGKKLTESICTSKRVFNIYPWSFGIEKKRENGFYFRRLALFLAPRYRKNVSQGLGCNMSFWKSDYIKINGYDEYFEGWGGEDDDFANRLLRSGCKKRYMKFAGIVYHLWHEEKFMQNKERNKNYLNQNNKEQTIWCDHGVDQYLEK